MKPIPPAIKRTQIIRIIRTMRLDRHVARTHDALAQVIDTMQEMLMIILRKRVCYTRRDARVDPAHHEEAV